MAIGDSLRERIDHGLANSRYGIVVLSPAFFAKDWPIRELDGLAARESRENRLILPVWHKVNQAFVARHSPILADRVAVTTDRGLDQVALAILRVIRPHDGEPHRYQTGGQAKSLFNKPDVMIGQAVGPYILVELIGAGGSGIVFRANQASSGLEIAVKVFYPLPASLGSFYQLFRRAFRTLASVSHPGIARALDFGRCDVAGTSVCYLSMEYVRGLPLDKWSRNLDSLTDPFKHRLRAALQLSEALAAAHETVYTDELGSRFGVSFTGISNPRTFWCRATMKSNYLISCSLIFSGCLIRALFLRNTLRSLMIDP